jgi:hypothetical protein
MMETRIDRLQFIPETYHAYFVTPMEHEPNPFVLDCTVLTTRFDVGPLPSVLIGGADERF